MASLADKAILSGIENRPPMLEKDTYDSWRTRMELYMLNRQHGRMILGSVEHGPLLWPSVTEDGVTRLKKYSKLSSAEATQDDCDVKETNIILQALPLEIYALAAGGGADVVASTAGRGDSGGWKMDSGGDVEGGKITLLKNDFQKEESRHIDRELAMEKQACFVCKSLDHLIKDCDYHEKKMAPTTARNHVQRGNHKQYARMTLLNPQRHVVPIAVLTQSKLVPITAVKPVTTVVPKLSVTRQRQAKTIVTKTNSPPKRHINRTFMPPKPDLVFNNAPNDIKTVYTAFNVKLSPTKPDNELSHTHRPSAPIIEDWVSDSEDESKTKTPQNLLSFVQPTEQIKSHMPSV
nr:hypothetical protein [Tanacetum cinerariifolium]